MDQATPKPATGTTENPALRAPSAEYALYDYAERLDKHRRGRVGIHIHLSKLQPHNRRDHHIRIATNTFESLVKYFDGQLFVLKNNDIIFVARDVPVEKIDDAVLRLRYLFSEDPLAQYADQEVGDVGFCTWYLLERDYPKFLALSRHFYERSMVVHAEKRLKEAATGVPVTERKPMSPAQLGKLEEALGHTDLANVIRNQPVCAYSSGVAPKAIFHELYVSIGELEEALMPGVQVTANRWLFQYLTMTLDKRMLVHLEKEGQHLERAFSINLNISTVLSGEFHRFDQNISSNLRGRLVIELQKMDVFGDMGAYLFARDYLHDRGYRVCLDGLTHLTLPYMDRDRLGLDMMKMYWSPELAAMQNSDTFSRLRDNVGAGGPTRIILTRCDNDDAITVGLRLGINMFQGRAMDTILANHTVVYDNRQPKPPPRG
jgi:hypothetical protein